MRRHLASNSLGIGALGLVLLAGPADGQPPPPPAGGQPSPSPAVGHPQAFDARGLVLMPHVTASSDKELVGLAESWSAETLTWDRVYTMAVVRARGGGKAAAESLDPKALVDEARRLEVGDFARFRGVFLAGRAFADPSGSYLSVLRRLQAVDDARRHIGALENLLRLVEETIQGESGGLSQSDVDVVAEALARGRHEMSREVAGLRDGIDELKLALGLSPHAAVVPDRRAIAAFRDVFTATDRWSLRPDRNLAELPRIVERLPAAGDVLVDGQPILGAVDQTPARLEDMLRHAARLAIKDRAGRGPAPAAGEGEAELELRVRRRVRHLLEIRRGSADAKRVYVLAVRLRDQAFERLFRPMIDERVPLRWPAIQGLVADMERCRAAEDRLATLWAAFRTERLELYRDLGVLPYDNWDAFYADLAADHATR